MNNSRRGFDPQVVHQDHNEGYENLRRNTKPLAQRGRGKRPPSRANYQSARLDSHRAVKSRITENDLADELRRKLLPGLKDNQTVADRLEVVNTFNAITLTISTRAMGFGTTSMFAALYQFNQVPIGGSIYQLYRVALAVLECKIIVTQRSVTCITDNSDDFARLQRSEEFVVAAKSVVVLPDQLSLPINSIGKIKIHDKLYVPKIGRDQRTRRDRFIPQSQQITYSNLRATVVALSDVNCPQRLRHDFYINNPIPGCIWEGLPDNPVLTNPDEVMPENFGLDDLYDDIGDVKSKINFLNRKAPKYFTKTISYEVEGTKSMLVSNKQGTLRVIDRNAGEPLPDYYQRIRTRGDVEEFFNVERLNTGEQLDGNICLLGEQPTTVDLLYPVYIMRDERTSCEHSSLRYKAAFEIKYT